MIVALLILTHLLAGVLGGLICYGVMVHYGERALRTPNQDDGNNP